MEMKDFWLVAEAVKEALLKEASQWETKIEVAVQEKKENGNTLVGLSVKDCAKSVGFLWYLPSGVVDDYLNEPEARECIINYCVGNIIDYFENSKVDLVMAHCGKLLKYEEVKDNIFPVLCSQERCKAELEDVPHRPFLDLAICYRIFTKGLGMVTGTVLITKEVMGRYGIDEETLYQKAMENVRKEFLVENLLDVMAGRLEETEPDPTQPQLYVVSKPDKHYGAGAILVKEKLDEIAKELGVKRFMIFPSSIHECLITDATAVDVQSAMFQVRLVNTYEVAEEEILSYSLYYYDVETGYGKY